MIGQTMASGWPATTKWPGRWSSRITASDEAAIRTNRSCPTAWRNPLRRVGTGAPASSRARISWTSGPEVICVLVAAASSSRSRIVKRKSRAMPETTVVSWIDFATWWMK